MGSTTSNKKDNTINIHSFPVQMHIGSLKFVNSDWGTMAYIIDRREVQNKFSDKELRYNCIYFLFGYDNRKEMCYVGQAKKRNNGESVLARLREHDDSTTEKYRDIWDWAVVVTNKNDEWTLDDLNALEHAFYAEIPLDQNLNGNNPNAGGADYNNYTDKINQIKSFVTAIGFNMFAENEETTNIEITSDTNDFSRVEDLQNGMARIPEIVTPQKVVKAMVDMLPSEVWNSHTVFLDPACKGGEYLREIYDRLMNTEILQSEYPNEFERSNHILQEQIYGIALSQVSLERTTKKLLGFGMNIRVIPNYINILKTKFTNNVSDADKREYIRSILNKEFGKTMKIDVVIGNPPYQEDTGGGNNGGRALYNFFIDMADKISKIQSFIIPSRWMSDKPNGLENNWLMPMRNRQDYVYMIDYADASNCFNGVNIAGGVCHYLINKDYKGDAFIKHITNNGEIQERKGKLATNGIVVRNQKIQAIANKVNISVENSIYQIIGTNRQFSPNDSYFATNWDGFSPIKDNENYIKYFANSRLLISEGYISEDELPDGTLELAKRFKMFLPLTGPTNNKVVNSPFIGGCNSCCSRTYAPMYGECIDNEEKASNCIKYWKTKFLRLLVSAIKTTQHATRQVYMLVPLQDFTSSSDIDWSQSIADIDKQLYKKYNLSQEEIDYIEKTIKPME